MTYNLLDAAKDFVTGNLEFVTATVSNERMAICNECEVQNKLTKICTACGCFLPAKTRLASADCPLELWAPVDFLPKQ